MPAALSTELPTAYLLRLCCAQRQELEAKFSTNFRAPLLIGVLQVIIQFEPRVQRYVTLPAVGVDVGMEPAPP